MAAQSPSSEWADDDGPRESSPPPPVPPIPFKLEEEDDYQHLLDVTEEEEEDDEAADNEIQNSPTPPVPSNRTSVDGMDPAFANVLKRSASGSSFTYNRSPLRQVLSRSTRGGGTLGRRTRGGTAFQEARPPSLVGRPNILAEEFGLGLDRSLNDTLELPERETAEFGCQTDVVEEPPVPAPTVVVTPSSTSLSLSLVHTAAESPR